MNLLPRQIFYLLLLLLDSSHLFFFAKNEDLPNNVVIRDGRLCNPDSMIAIPKVLAVFVMLRFHKFLLMLRWQADLLYAKEVMTLIGAMYGVERRAKKRTSEERLIMRQQESLSLMDSVFAWCRKNRDKYLPKEPAMPQLERTQMTLTSTVGVNLVSGFLGLWEFASALEKMASPFF
jgi:hypothetical protein